MCRTGRPVVIGGEAVRRHEETGVLRIFGGVTSCLLASALSLAAPAMAQVEPGRIYTGGEQISDPSLGLTLTLPAATSGSRS